MKRKENISNFIPAVVSILSETENDIYFLFCNDELLAKSVDNITTIPTKIDLKNLNLKNVQYLGAMHDKNCYYGEISKDEIISKDMYFNSLRALSRKLTEEMFWIAGRAVQMVNFNHDHKFCGRCGSLTENLEGERAKKCPKCGFITYPRICPAIIVAVINNGKLLLAHNNNSPKEMYSVVAGFVEAGETFEECVSREVLEETGISVKNIKYFGNQPWPFPNSLMIGYTAEYASGEIKVDGKEIGHAEWYGSDKMPVTPDSISISKDLIDWFKVNY